MRIYLLRHGKTAGNLQRLYIGSTDQPLAEAGKEEMAILQRDGYYPVANKLYSSPMLRCIQTGELLYPQYIPEIVNGLQECSFGIFECLSYQELKDNKNYQKWIDSNGLGDIPQGENSRDFKLRCIRAFTGFLDHALANKEDNIALIIHGGSIMTILEAFYGEEGSFYDWQIKNGRIYCLEIDEKLWHEKRKIAS
ncbi:MAG: histidine phosphatase family protein, partial [Clostridiales bacterium]